MSTINAYLTFNGNCHEAMKFYQDALGGELTLQSVGGMPVEARCPAGEEQQIMHAQLIKGDLVLMGTDMQGPAGFIQGTTMSLALQCDTEEEINASKNKKIEKTLRIPDRIENSVVILMDVLEHLEDDLKMLQEIKAAAVGNNNYFFITVPAFTSLWSGHDDYLGHYRRYKIASLTAVLKKAGYTTENSYYLYGSLFPMVWAARKLSNLRKKEATSNMKPFSPVVNKLLLGITSAEMALSSANKVFGVTCVAQGKI